MGNNVLEILITAKDEATSKLNGLASSAKAMSGSFLAVGGVITTAFGFAVKAAADAEVQMAKVNATLSAMGKNTPEVASAIQKAADATLKLGFDNEEASVSIAKLYQKTGDLTQATKLNSLAMDLARSKYISLTDASKAVSMVLSGNTKVLKELGVEINENLTPMQMLTDAQSKLSGQAQAFSETFQGQMEVMKQGFGEIVEQVGGILLPILTSLIAKLQPVLEKIKAWTEAHPELTRVIVLVVAGLGLLLTVIGAIGLALPVIITGFGLMLGPIGLVVLAVGLLIAAGIALILKWKEVKEFFYWTWEGIKLVFKESIDALLDYFKPLIDMIQRVIDLASKVGSAISGAVSKGVSSVSGKRAQGGNVAMGSTYLVGENGPEFFTPAGSGNITPNGAIGGASTFNFNVSLNGGVITEDFAKRLGDVMIAQFRRTAKI